MPGSAMPVPLPPLARRESTAEAVAAVLRTQIAGGAIRPGTQLREEHIASALEVSRNTVREAFRLLSHERLVEHALHRGVFVRVSGPQEVRDIYRTRRFVEPLGMRAVVQQAAGLRELADAVAAGRAAADAGDWDAVGTADIDFHRGLVAACSSVHLEAMFEGVLAELRLAFLRLPDAQALHQPFLLRNEGMVVLLEAGDLHTARRELDDYLHEAEAQLLAVIDA